MSPALLASALAGGTRQPLGGRPTGSDAGFWSRRSGFESLPPSRSASPAAPAAPASSASRPRQEEWTAQQAVVALVPPGTHSVSRESSQPELEMSNR